MTRHLLNNHYYSLISINTNQGRRKWGGWPPQVFGQTVNPILTRGADYIYPLQYYEPPQIFRPCDGPANFSVPGPQKSCFGPFFGLALVHILDFIFFKKSCLLNHFSQWKPVAKEHDSYLQSILILHDFNFDENQTDDDSDDFQISSENFENKVWIYRWQKYILFKVY